MAGNSNDQQSSAPQATEPEETAAAQQQSAPPPAPEEEPAQAQAPEQAGETPQEPPQGDAAAGETLTTAQSPDADAEAEAPAGTGTGARPPQGNVAAELPQGQPPAGPTEDGGEDGEESEEERRRVIEMTRTVQLSLEQIMARMADVDPGAGDEEPSGEDTAPAAADGEEPRRQRYREEPSLGRRIGRAAGSGVLSITRWLLLVVFFVALIAAIGIAFLYRSATPDLIPKVSVTLGGQTVQPTAYDWNVPVVNSLFSRNYHATLSEQALPLAQTVEGIRPELVVTPQDFETELQLKDSSGNVLFEGNAFTYAEFAFEKDGTYTGELTVRNQAGRFDDNAVEGSQTYDFTFDISLHPTVRLDSSSALQGDIIAVVAGGIPLNDKPTLVCDLANPGFMPAQDGWIAYVPIPVDAEPGEYTFEVKSRSHEQTLTLAVHERDWRDVMLMQEEELNWAYIGPDNTPPEVQQVLGQNEDTIYWHDEGFAMPYDREVTPDLEFGTTETVDNRDGTTTRRSINLVATLPNAWYASDLVAPAAGRVVFAEDLGGVYSPVHGIMLPNKTLVIDHGGGIKTVFYNLNTFDVAVGDVVEQGQKIGTSQLTLCIGAYVGEVPVDSTILWQGKCNAVRYY